MTPKDPTDLDTLAAYAEGQQPTPQTRAMAQALLAAMGVTRDALLPKLGNN